MTERIRLNIGALTTSKIDGGSFMFILYRETMDRSLSVTLSPAETHAVLSNFSNSTKDDTTHTLLFSILNSYRIELLDVDIIRDNEKDGFLSEIHLFDGEKNLQIATTFIDGVILAKKFACPIYIMEDVWNKFSTKVNKLTKGANEVERSLELLKNELATAIENEEYERAAKINKIIGKIKKNN